MNDPVRQRYEDLTLICSKLNAQNPGSYHTRDGHFSHYVRKLLQGAINQYPDVVGLNGVEGEIVLDVNGGGMFTVGFSYINAGDSYTNTITWRNDDPFHPHEGKFRVECWADALEACEAIRDHFYEDNPEYEYEEEVM